MWALSNEDQGLLAPLTTLVTHLFTHLFVLMLTHFFPPLLNYAAHIANLVNIQVKNERWKLYSHPLQMSRRTG